MKTISIIIKSLKEQVRSYWVLLLSLSMGPFFIFVYFLIIETSKPDYDIIIVNNDKGIVYGAESINHGKRLITFFRNAEADTITIPLNIEVASDLSGSIERVKSRKADALIIIDSTFSATLEKRRAADTSSVSELEFQGDLTSASYLISAIWANEIINEYTLQATRSKRVVEISETALGSSGSIDDFDIVVPGLLIVSLIMLMFTASIAFVSEVENKTIMRLKMSGISTFEFLGGTSVVQLLVGIISVLLTLTMAIMLGFKYSGSLSILVFIAALTSFSLIAFSLIIAAVTKSSNEVLVVGNFPMFLFMFFTGAAFPLKSDALFTIAGYPVTIQGLMTPSHAISALNKTLVMDMGLKSIMPEIIAIVLLTIVYFFTGALIFKHRHLKLT